MVISMGLLERLLETAVICALPFWLFLKREIPDMQRALVQAVFALWELSPKNHSGHREVSSPPQNKQGGWAVPGEA